MAIESRKGFATDLISEEDYKALNLVLNNPLRLSTKEFNLGGLISKVMVEFSEERKCNVHKIDASAIRAGLAQLEKQQDAVYKKYSKVRDKWNTHRDRVAGEKSQILEREMGEISCSINKAKALLQNSVDGKIEVKEEIMGEFISSPNPKVVLYYNNINDGGLVPVFVHEMFHAWNYFKAEEEKKAVREIDEAMVEFATMHFLNTLAESLKKSDKKEADLISTRADWHKKNVKEKKKAVGSTAAYGFGFYLSEKISRKASLWIETYANKSASLDPDDHNVTKVKTSLAPFYPFNNEDEVFKQLEEIIFPTTKKTPARVKHISQVDVLKSCLDTMSKDEFTLEDIYVFEPIFTTLYPRNMHLRDKLRQLLQKLVAQGDVIRVSSGCYKKN